MVEKYAARYMPQYDALDVDLVHAGLFLIIRRGILVEMLKRGSGDAQHYFEQHVQKLNVETSWNSPFVNKKNFVGNFKVIANVMRKGKPLGHHKDTDGLVSSILDYMRLHFRSETNGNDSVTRFNRFYHPLNENTVRCMSCQRTFSRKSSTTREIRRHFITSRDHSCRNLNRNVVYHFISAYPEFSGNDITFQSEEIFENVSDETVTAGPQGHDNVDASYLGNHTHSSNPAIIVVTGSQSPHVMEREDAGAAGHPPPAPSNQDN